MVKDVVNFTLKDLNQLINDTNSCVEVTNSSYELALYPFHLNNFAASIKEILNGLIGKYNKKLHGILLAYKNVKVLSNEGSIIADSCYIHINLVADFYLFKPEEGSTLVGIVNKKSGDHIGCLVHQVFNVSIPNVVDDSDWIGHDVKIGKQILINISHVNFNGMLPYIKAKLISIIPDPLDETVNVSQEVKPKKSKKHKHDDVNINSTVDNSTHEFNETDISIDINPKKSKKRKRTSEGNDSGLHDSLLNDTITNPDTSIDTNPKKSNKRKRTSEVDETISKQDTSIDIKKSKKRKRTSEADDSELLTSNLETKSKHKRKKLNGDATEVKELESLDVAKSLKMKQNSTQVSKKKRKSKDITYESEEY